MVKKIRRAIALFLTLVMFLSMANLTVLAAETPDHVHNEEGWNCSQGEPTQELTCTDPEHEHNGDCYTPGELELTCEQPEHGHTDECYDETGELACGQEEHEHSGDCYTPSEPVLTCGQSEHEHNNDCYTTVEGEWTCVKTEEPEVFVTVPSFGDLQAAVTDSFPTGASEYENGALLENGHYGYAWSRVCVDSDTWSCGIEAWDDGDVRYIKLHESVIYDPADGVKGITIQDRSVNLDLNGKTIDGGYRADAEGNEIDPGSNASVIMVVNANAGISNGTVTGGNGGNSGGIYAANNSTLSLTNVDVRNNRATNGGGMFIENSDLTMTGGSISDNKANNNGGGIYTKGTQKRVNAVLTGVVISGNDGSSYGGGIRTWGTDMTLNDVTVTNNRGWFGGGILLGSETDLTMNGGTLTGNCALGASGERFGAGGGGGMYIDRTRNQATLNGVLITGNMAGNSERDDWKGNGGGIFLGIPDASQSDNYVTLILGEDNRIYGNTSQAGRSDIYACAGTTVVNVGKAPLAPEGETYDGWYTGNGAGEKYTGPETMELAVDLAGNVTIIPTTYTVVHEYYTNGDLDGATRIDVDGVAVGDVVEVEDITKVTSYGRDSYTFNASRSDVGITLGETGNVITLRYYRTVSTGGSTAVYYTLTINYVDTNGNTVADSYTHDLRSGRTYSISSPEVEGMTPDREIVSGALTGDLTVTVVYTAVEDIEDPDTPTTETPVPSESKEPVEDGEDEDLEDEKPPLAETPDVEPGETEEPETPDETEELEDPDTPLAEVPQTGDSLWLWLTLAVLSALGLAWIGLNEKKAGKRII